MVAFTLALSSLPSEFSIRAIDGCITQRATSGVGFSIESDTAVAHSPAVRLFYLPRGGCIPREAGYLGSHNVRSLPEPYYATTVDPTQLWLVGL